MKSNLTKNKFKVVFTDKLRDFSPTIVNSNIPGLNIGVIEVPTKVITLKKPAGELTFNTLELSFIVDEKMESFETIYNWIVTLRSIDEMIQTDYFEQMTLQIYTPDGETLRKEIQFTDIFPTSLSEIIFDTVDEEDKEIATVTFEYLSYDFL